MTTQSKQGGSQEQHVKPDGQSHKNTSDGKSSASGSKSDGGSTRGGSPEQHAKAGQQSHKNS